MARNFSKILICVCCLQAYTSGTLQAESAPTGSHFDIGPSLSTITYKEPGIMKEDGLMSGLSGSYSLYLNSHRMVRLEAAAALGSVDYSSTNTGSISSIDDSMIEARALLGEDFISSGSTVARSFVGFGYRRLNDKLEGKVSTTGATGYDRHSNYYYSPIGIEISTAHDQGWSVGGTVEYDYFWGGTQNNVNYIGGLDITNDQKRGYGLRASARFQKKMGAMYSLAFEPFIRYWNIDESDPVSVTVTGSGGGQQRYTIWEPKNNSTEYGLRVLLVF